MSTYGLRELRQDASSLVQRAQDGEEITITVSGRPAARLIGPQPARWRRWADLSDLFDGPADPSWTSDSELLDGGIRDPWASV